MRKYLLLSVALMASFSVFSQDFSNKGKDFYLCFPQHVPSGLGNLAKLSIWITSDKASSGTITVANGGYSNVFNIPANGLAEIQVPFSVAHISNGESTNETTTQILKKSIRVLVDPGQPAVVAYVQQFANARSAATLLLPVNVLGKKYFAVSFTQSGSNQAPYNARSQFQIIATRDNTTVNITPMKNGVAGTTFTVTFPLAGDMIQYQSNDGAAATQDLTGTYIESVSLGVGGCSPIAVFSGSSNLTMGSASPACNGGSYDPLFQQLYPVSTWGKNFGFVPIANYPRGVPYRVMASQDNTNVYFNGVLVANLNAGKIYPAAFTSQPTTLTAPTSITADKPICVTEYMQASGCSGLGSIQGDPDMVVLNPIEQNISDITIFSTKQEFIRTQWVNVLMKTVAIPSFKMSRNGCPLAPPSGTWQPFAALPGYSYLQQALLLPGTGACQGASSISDSYRMVSDSGFNAIAYGLGDNESYSYSAGTNVKDLTQQLVLATQYGIETSPSVCTNSPFNFKVYFPDSTTAIPPTAIRFDSVDWKISNPAIIVPNNFTVRVINPTIDSTNLQNGRQVNWYSLPGYYTFTTAGTDTLTLTTYSSTNEGCGNSQDYDFPIQISDPPIANFSYILSGCYADPVRFTETTPQLPKPTYHFWWNFGDPLSGAVNDTSALRNPTHTFSGPGTYHVRFSDITTPGCLSDTVAYDILIPDLPSATASGTTAVCLNSPQQPVTFTGTLGSPEYIFTYNINGGPELTATSNLGIAQILAPTNVAGVFVYTLDSVRNQLPPGSLCTRHITGQQVTITVNPLPNAAISGGTTVCLNAAMPPVTFTGSGGTAPYTFNYSINGTPQAPVVSNLAGTYTLNAPTNVAGPFTYSITMVTDGSSTACSISPLNVSTTITVQPLPNATINTSAIAACLNGTAPTITFTGSGGTAAYTFNYTLNGVPQPPLVSNGVGVATITVPVTTATTYNYVLTSVQEGSPSACVQNSLPGQQVTVTINPLPTAAISGGTTVCLNAAMPPVTFTGSGGTAPYTFNYTINGIGQAPVVSDLAGIYTLNAPTNVAGPFIYQITMVTDATTTACNSSPPNITTTINVQPLPNATINTSAIAVCLNGTAPTITFTGSGGTAVYTFNYTINGVPQAPLVSNGAGVATVTVPVTTATTYIYVLTSVQEGSANACVQNSLPGQQVTVTVNPIPTAAISGGSTVCKNAVAASIIFTGSGGTAPYTFNYTINGVAQPAVVSDLAGNYTINPPTTVTGPFIYTITNVTDGSSTTCTSSPNVSTTLTVNPLPSAAISGGTTVCLNGAQPPVTFTGSGGTAPYTFNYSINGIGQAPVVSNPAGTYTLNAPTNVAGPFTYTITLVTDASTTTCSSVQNASITITVQPLPNATINTSAIAACLNGTSPTITFTGSGGTAVYTFSYTLNGVPQTPLVSNGAGIATITVPVTTVTTYNYVLTSVQEGSANACVQNSLPGQQVTVTINPIPTAAISGGTTVCLNAAMPPVTFTGSGGTAPYTFNYTINGIGQAPVVSDLAGNYTLNAPTNVAGPFIYRITTVTDASSTTCSSSPPNVTTTITVQALPNASITTSATAVCLNGTAPTITFTGSGGTAAYTFNYTINGVPQTPLVSNGAGVATITVPVTTATTYNYVLTSVQEGSANACVQNNLPGQQVTVTVNPSPSAAISGTIEVCKNSAPMPVITFTGSLGTPPYTFTYNINGTPQPPLPSDPTGIATVSCPTTVANTFVYTLTGVQDASSTTCTNNVVGQQATVIVDDLPTPGFSFSAPDCQSKNITFTDGSTPNSGTLTGWVWDFGDGSPTGSGTPVTHSYTNTGVYNVTLTVSTSKGCINTLTQPVNVTVNPQAGFKIPAICLNDVAAVFTDTSKISAPGTFNFAQFWWDFGDPASGAANQQYAVNGTHTFSNVGNFLVTHVAVSNAGCTDTVKQNVFVNGSNPIASFTPNNAASLCANDSVSITNNSTVAPGNITKIEIYWDNVNNPGGPPDQDNSPTFGKIYKHLYPNFQAPLTKNFQIRFLAYSGIICVNEQIQIITVNAAPKVQFNPLADACYLAAPFQIPQPANGGVPGSGIFSGPGVSPSGIFSPAVAGIGTHTIKYTYTAFAAGCVDTASQNIVVLDTAFADFTYNSPVCAHTDVTFTEASTAPAGVVLANTVWDFNDGTPIENHAPGSVFTHVFPNATTYNVSMYNESAYGCKSTVRTKPVAISPIPNPLFSADKPSYCLPNASVIFDGSLSTIADGTENQFTYLWDFGDPGSGANNSSTAKIPTHVYTGTGPFNVTLTVTSGVGCIKSITIPLTTVHPQPVAAFSPDKPSVCILTSVTFTDNTDPTAGATTQDWHWDLGDGSVMTGVPSFTYTYTSLDTFNVSLYITNSFGCNSDTLTQPFPVYNYPTVDPMAEVFVLEGGSVTLNPTATGDDLQYLWTPDLYLDDRTKKNPVVTDPKTDITYTLQVTGRGGCPRSQTVFVKLLKFPKIPNTFTPNGDGVNDKWVIGYLDTYPNNLVQVFNRTGQLIYESHGYKRGTEWEGTYKGKPLPVDTYYYIIEPGNGREPLKGYVTIIR